MSTSSELLSQAKAYQAAGRFSDAEPLYQQILAEEPGHAEALAQLGGLFDVTGRWPAAIEALQRAVQLQPDYAEAYNYLGAVLAEHGRLDEAISSFEQASRLRPDSPDVQRNLQAARADQQHELGESLADAGRVDEAIACFRRAMEFNPQHLAAHGNLGNALLGQGRLDEAAEWYQRVLAIDPNSALAHFNLGQVAKRRLQLHEAETHNRRALVIEPSFTAANVELAFALAHQGRLDEGMACYEQVLAREPNHADAQFGRGAIRLLQGQFAAGWPDYEARLRRAEGALAPLAGPTWQGEPVAGRTIVLRGEQGLGDTIQFARYAQRLRNDGARVIVECRAPLVSLLASSPWIDQVIERGQPIPAFDFQVPLLSLPGLYRTTEETIPAEIPYFTPDMATVHRWREALAQITAARPDVLRVGIVWQGSPAHTADVFRSVPLETFRRLAQLPGVQLFSFQFGPGSEQAATSDVPLVDLSSHLGDFRDTAAAMGVMDLMIVCDSAAAHLAGAIGMPVWVALAKIPDWRWMLDRKDSPWYPTMRLFRQEQLGEWESPFQKIEASLAAMCQARGAQG